MNTKVNSGKIPSTSDNYFNVDSNRPSVTRAAERVNYKMQVNYILNYISQNCKTDISYFSLCNESIYYPITE